MIEGFGSSPYVIRLLPDGTRDADFGNGGEVDTDLGLPQEYVNASERRAPQPEIRSIAVDSQDRPIIGGSYIQGPGPAGCGGYARAAFVTRLTASGSVDASFAGKGYASVDGSSSWVGMSSLAVTPADEPAVVSQGTSMCIGPKPQPEPSHLNAFTEVGLPSPKLDPARPNFSGEGMVIDPKGRFLAFGVDSYVTRRLPNGDVDNSFGRKGSITLSAIGALAVDAKSRPLVAGGAEQVELRRLQTNGKIDKKFGKVGVVDATGGTAEGIALDRRGRIYVASVIKASPSVKSRRLEIARVLPGS